MTDAEAVALEDAIFYRISADPWTKPNPEIGPDWHLRFSRWQARRAAQLAMEVIRDRGSSGHD